MQSTQGFYKFKKTVMPKVCDTGTARDTIVRLYDNYSAEAYSYINSVAGDMIKSIGYNLANYPVLAGRITSAGVIKDCSITSDGEIVLSTEGTVSTTNGSVTTNFMIIDVDRPCKVAIVCDHISGNYLKGENHDVPSNMGHQLQKINSSGEALSTAYSGVSVKKEIGKYINYVNVTQDDIDNGVVALKLRPWANGTIDGGAKFDDLTYTILATVIDTEELENDTFEPYVETTKVCDQNGHCYCLTYPNGTLYSLNGNEIGVDYVKSSFARSYRLIANRVQNLDASDTSSENRQVLFFGDSITAGSGATQLYHMWLSRYTGMKCINWGHGGAGYLREDSSTAYSGDGKEGRGNLEQQTGDNTVLKTMQAVGDFENCFIAAGTNEYGGNFPIADFRTAVQNTLDYAQTKASRILVLTPIRRPNFDNPNTEGKKLHEYSEVIIEECAARGIPYIDGFDIPMNPNNSQSKGWYYSAGDGLHPSNNGHKFMAGWILDKFKAVFKV